MQMSVSSFINVKALIQNNKSFLISRSVAPRHDVKYVNLDLTLIECIQSSAGARLEL